MLTSTTDEMLKYAVENGMLDISTIQSQIEMNERKKYIDKHLYSIWKGKDNKWYTYLPDEIKGRRKIKRKTEKEVQNVVIDFYKRQEKEPIVEKVFYEWLNKKLEYGEIVNQTYDKYQADFIRYFGKISQIKMKSVTVDILEDFIKSTIHDMQLTAKAWANMRILIRGMFKYAKKRKYTEISISQFFGDLDLPPKIFSRNVVKDEEQVFTEKEIELIKEQLWSEEPTALNLGLLLAMETGLRTGELSTLKYQDLHDVWLSVRRQEIRYKDRVNGGYIFKVVPYTKGKDGYRDVVVTDEAIKIIKMMRFLNPSGEYLFIKDGIRVRGKLFTSKLYRTCRKVGILERSEHKLRKKYATVLFNKGIDEKSIQKQMGHQNISTTQNFYYFNDKEKVEEAQHIRSVLGEKYSKSTQRYSNARSEKCL